MPLRVGVETAETYGSIGIVCLRAFFLFFFIMSMCWLVSSFVNRIKHKLQRISIKLVQMEQEIQEMTPLTFGAILDKRMNQGTFSYII